MKYGYILHIKYKFKQFYSFMDPKVCNTYSVKAMDIIREYFYSCAEMQDFEYFYL